MATTHTLKVWTEFFPAIQSGAKNFEVRRNDRWYQVGDVLELVSYDPGSNRVLDTPPEYRRITYILRGKNSEKFGVVEGFCVLGLEKMEYERTDAGSVQTPA